MHQLMLNHIIFGGGKLFSIFHVEFFLIFAIFHFFPHNTSIIREKLRRMDLEIISIVCVTGTRGENEILYCNVIEFHISYKRL